MRITGGRHRGRRLGVPAGVRPTGARLREALFSIWGRELEGGRVLDLFAGSGAVGLDSLSRGASFVVLVEKSARVIRVLERNCRLFDRGWRIARGALPADMAKAIEPGESPFDFVFADPPYSFKNWTELLSRLDGCAAPDGVVAIEHNSRAELPKTVGNLEMVNQRRYGESSLTFYSR